MGTDPRHSLTAPQRHDLEAAFLRFDADWGLVDEVLYSLCREYPGHDDLRAVTAKLALVGRVYAAGLERLITPPPGQQAIVIIAGHVLRNGGEVDSILRALDPAGEPLDRVSMASIVEQHGRLTQLLQKAATDGKAPRSFASKYLHFHRPVVPIYDEYARQKINRLVRWESSYEPFPLPPHGDLDYWRYSVRFFRIYNACRQAGIDATVKELDAFLWAVPVASAGA